MKKLAILALLVGALAGCGSTKTVSTPIVPKTTTPPTMVTNQENWQELASFSDVTLYIDTNTKVQNYRGNRIVGFWDKAVYRGGKYAIAKSFSFVDCKNKTMSNLTQFVGYTKNGKILENKSEPIKGFSRVESNSTGEQMFDAVCATQLFHDFRNLGTIGYVTEQQVNHLLSQYPYHANEFMEWLSNQ